MTGRTAGPAAGPFGRASRRSHGDRMDLRAGTDAGYRPGDHTYRRVVFGLALGGFANFMALYYVQPLLPGIADVFHVSASASAAVLSLPTITMAVALLFVGPLSDVIGRVAIMRISLAGSAVAGISCAFVPSWHGLLLVRAIEGVALAGLPAAALAYLREEMHPGAHLRANAAYITGTASGGAAGRLLPGPFNAVWGWQGAALAAGCVTLLAAVGLWVLVPGSRRFTGSSARLVGLLRNTWLTLRDPGLAALCLAGAALMGAFVGLFNAMAFRLEAAPYRLGDAAVLVFLAYPLGLLAPNVASRIAARLGRGSTALIFVTLVLAGTALTVATSLAVIVIGIGMVTFAFLGTHSLASGWVAGRAHRSGLGVGQASGLYLLAFYVGSSVFGAVVTYQWQAGGWHEVTMTCVILIVAGGICVFTARCFDAASRPTGSDPRPDAPS